MNIIKERGNSEEESVTVLGGIDTLYYFITKNDAQLYQNTWDKAKVGEELKFLNFLGFSGQNTGFVGSWYECKDNQGQRLFRVGFKDPNKQQQLPNIQVQLEGYSIYRYTLLDTIANASEVLYDLIGSVTGLEDYQVSRADLNAFVAGYDFASVTSSCFRTRSKNVMTISDTGTYIDQKSHVYQKDNTLQTLYLGSKKSGLVFKIYDKRLELMEQIEKGSVSASVKLAYLTCNGLTSDHLWNVEFTLKRNVLKEYKINTVQDLINASNSLFKDLMKKTVFLGEDWQKYNELREQNNLHRLPAAPVWQKITDDYNYSGDMEVKRVYEKSKGMTAKWILDQVKSLKRKAFGFDIDFNHILQNLDEESPAGFSRAPHGATTA